MCGRYTTGTEAENVRFREIMEEASRSLDGDERLARHENGDFYPGDNAPVIVTISSKIRAVGMQWGFDIGGRKVINARSETAHEKPAFRQSVDSMRCLVPVTGYYEWNDRKEKFLFRAPDGNIFYLAGLFRYSEKGRREFTIMTREAYGAYAEIHDRMPLIIRNGDLWLREPGRTREMLRGGGDVKLDIICQSPQQISMF